MIEKTLTVTNEEGLHTRPANAFVKKTKGFEATVTLAKSGETVPGKSLLKIMKLGIIKGDEVVLACDGADEEKAVSELAEIICPPETGESS